MSLLVPDIEQQTKSVIQNTIIGALSTLEACFNNVMKYVWENPYGLTPQQVHAVMGTNMAEVYAIGQEILPILNNALEKLGKSPITTIVPAGVTATPHEDGTVTLA